MYTIILLFSGAKLEKALRKFEPRIGVHNSSDYARLDPLTLLMFINCEGSKKRRESNHCNY